MNAESSSETPIQESQNEIGIGQHLHNLKQLKSFEILKSALKIFKSNAKFTFLVILSIFPLFLFIFFFEFKLQKSIIYASSNSPFKLQMSQIIHLVFDYNGNSLNSRTSNTPEKNQTQDYSYYFGGFQINTKEEFLSNALQISVFYLFLYPLLEFLTMIFTIKIAAKVDAADKQATIGVKEMLCQKVNLKNPSIAYLCVHLLSTVTLLGLFWVVTNHKIFTGKLYYYYYYSGLEMSLNILSITVHSVIFLGLLYKYLDWSAFWNLGLVISVMEEVTGIGALGMSDYYGKHCRKTGFQLMLVFFMFGNVPRLFALFAALSNGSAAGVLTNFIVVSFYSMGNLVKWVAFLRYCSYCKQKTMEKKVDDQELGQTVSGDVMA